MIDFQVSIVTAMEHAELMKKVENLNLLSDSNKLLRDEKERLLQQLREAEAKVGPCWCRTGSSLFS